MRSSSASIRYIRERAPAALVILDAKRGDIGNTAEAYAREAFDRYGADAVTVNPYMGEDSVRPFLKRRGIAARCCFAAPPIPAPKIFRIFKSTACPCMARVALARRPGTGTSSGNLMFVVGATYPREMA